MLLFTELLMQQLLYEMFADFQQVYNHIPNHYFFFRRVSKRKKKREKKKTKVTIGSFIIELIGGIKEKNRSHFN